MPDAARKERRTGQRGRSFVYKGKLDYLAFQFVRLALNCIFKLYCGFKVHGSIPKIGPCLVAANHSSYLDAFLLGTACKRRLRFVMTDLYAKHALTRWFFDWNGVILVKEEGMNREMYRKVLSSLQQGEAIGIFPEGSMSDDAELQEILPGTIAFAQRLGVPVVPVGIIGSYNALPRTGRLPKPARISVRIGDALPPDELFSAKLSRGEALKSAALRLGDEIGKLLKQG